jgi:hypothetical protein
MTTSITGGALVHYISIAAKSKRKTDKLLRVLEQSHTSLDIYHVGTILEYNWMQTDTQIERVLRLCDDDALLYTVAGRVPYGRAASLARLHYVLDLLKTRTASRWWGKFNTIGLAVWTIERQPKAYVRELILHFPGLAWYVYYEGETDYQTRELNPWIASLIESCPDPSLTWSLFEERRGDGVSNSVSLDEFLQTTGALSRAHLPTS